MYRCVRVRAATNTDEQVKRSDYVFHGVQCSLFYSSHGEFVLRLPAARTRVRTKTTKINTFKVDFSPTRAKILVNNRTYFIHLDKCYFICKSYSHTTYLLTLIIKCDKETLFRQKLTVPELLCTQTYE